MNRRATDNISLKRLLWMGVVVIGASLPHWMALPYWIPCLLLAAVSWRAAARVWPLPLPNRIVRVILAIAAFALVLSQYRTINGLNAGSALLVVMISLKFLESRTQRDQLVLMLISYFLVFAGLLYQDSTASGAYLFAFVWITTIGLLQLSRRGDLMRNLPTAKMAGRLLLQATPVMLVLFLLFPRLPGPLWTIPGGGTDATTGLSESMSPGDITQLGLSDAIAFRVSFLTPPPPASELYWRGPVLAHFNGRTWTRREGMWGNARNTLEFQGQPIRYRVMQDSDPRGWVFALEMPESWSAPRRQNIVMQSDYQLRGFFREGFSARFDYEITSYTQFAAREALSGAQRDLYLDVPEELNPRTTELMAGIAAASRGPRDIIDRTLDVFRSDQYFYTLTPPPLGEHSIDDFVFETKEGFCEHYASAFAIMMRLAGIPARVVTGYQGGELNNVGNYYVVRQSNAHAWTEVWLEDRGWVRVDPLAAVAPERISLGFSQGALNRGLATSSAFERMGVLRQIALAWDAVNTYWDNWVVGYGPALQRALMDALGLGRLVWAQMLSLAILAALVVLGALSVALAWSSRARKRVDPAARQFDRFARRATRGKLAARGSAEGPVAFGRRVADALPHQSRTIEQIVEAYLNARYEQDTAGHALQRLRMLVDSFRPTRRPATG
jgi:transglutaminase-like putative cysteine protease